MKIARNVALSERSDEWYAPHPGSLSEGAGSPQGLTEGVSSDGCSEPMVIRKPFLALNFLSGYVHRGTLPQSRIRSTAPSGREPGMGLAPFSRVLAKIRECGRFSSPLRKLKSFYTPPFIGPPGNRKISGDFHRPYGALNVLHFTIQPGWGALWAVFLWETWKIKYNGCKLNQNDVK